MSGVRCVVVFVRTRFSSSPPPPPFPFPPCPPRAQCHGDDLGGLFIRGPLFLGAAFQPRLRLRLLDRPVSQSPVTHHPTPSPPPRLPCPPPCPCPTHGVGRLCLFAFCVSNNFANTSDPTLAPGVPNRRQGSTSDLTGKAVKPPGLGVLCVCVF